jgi:hypothetical protein
MKLFSGSLVSSTQKGPMPIKVAIVDDDAGVLTKLGNAVARFNGCACVGQFASGEEAVAA